MNLASVINKLNHNLSNEIDNDVRIVVDNTSTEMDELQQSISSNVTAINTELDKKLNVSTTDIGNNTILFLSNKADNAVILRNPDQLSYTAPSAYIGRAYRVQDGAGNILGDIRFRQETSGEISTGLVARYTAEDGTQTSATFALTPNKGGVVGTKVATINGKQILTETTPHVTQTYVSGTSWYRVWSDGWIEQGGKLAMPSTECTVTFHKAFTTTNYNIHGSSAGTTNALNVEFKNKTTTSVVFDYSGTNTGNFYWMAVGK